MSISHQRQLYSHRPSLWLSTAHPCRQSSKRGVLFTRTLESESSVPVVENIAPAPAVFPVPHKFSTWSCEFNSSTWSSCPWWRWSRLCQRTGIGPSVNTCSALIRDAVGRIAHNFFAAVDSNPEVWVSVHVQNGEVCSFDASGA